MSGCIADNVAQIRQEISAACRAAGRHPNDVRLIAVTKSQEPSVLAELAAADVYDFGENRMEHLMQMAAAAPSLARFHHIGRIQSRQIPEIAEYAACVHGLADADHARRLARACAERQRRMPVFLQINTSGEASKAGGGPETLPILLDIVRALPELDVLGLMTMAPPIVTESDIAVVQRAFADLRELAQQHHLSRLSMGMSGDFTLAIAEGATDVRIGSRLFA